MKESGIEKSSKFLFCLQKDQRVSGKRKGGGKGKKKKRTSSPSVQFPLLETVGTICPARSGKRKKEKKRSSSFLSLSLDFFLSSRRDGVASVRQQRKKKREKKRARPFHLSDLVLSEFAPGMKKEGRGRKKKRENLELCLPPAIALRTRGEKKKTKSLLISLLSYPHRQGRMGGGGERRKRLRLEQEQKKGRPPSSISSFFHA